MRLRKRSLLLAISLILALSASAFGTVAYFTSTAQVTNTFTVGDVQIMLDETAVDENGAPLSGRVTANAYHIVPGVPYLKDPAVTVKASSEEAYVRMRAEITNYAAVKAALGLSDAQILPALAPDLNTADWLQQACLVEDNTLKVTFWYKEPVATGAEDRMLPPLFETFQVPGALTRDQLQAFADMNMNIFAEAIQAASFTDAQDAWAAFEKQ